MLMFVDDPSVLIPSLHTVTDLGLPSILMLAVRLLWASNQAERKRCELLERAAREQHEKMFNSLVHVIQTFGERSARS